MNFLQISVGGNKGQAVIIWIFCFFSGIVSLNPKQKILTDSTLNDSENTSAIQQKINLNSLTLEKYGEAPT